MSSALVRAAEIKLKTTDWPTKQSLFSAKQASTPLPASLSARPLLRGATQNLWSYLLRGLVSLYTQHELRRDAPCPPALRIHSRVIKSSQAIAILRGTGHVLGPKPW